jgi:hypothetical protein
MWKRFQNGHIISLRDEVWAHKTGLIQPGFDRVAATKPGKSIVMCSVC